MSIDYYTKFRALTSKHINRNQLGGNHYDDDKHVFENVHSISSYKSNKNKIYY